MLPATDLNTLETDRITLRPQRVSDAAVYRQLWTARDLRVPQHRQINLEGRPTEEDIATQIRDECQASKPGLLAVERKATGDVIGYCGLVFNGNGSNDEPELAFELLLAIHNKGYSTEAGWAVVRWAGEACYRLLWATVWDWNVASRRVLKKLGFRDTGRVSPEIVRGQNYLTVLEF